MKETALTNYLSKFGSIPLPEGEIMWLQNTLVVVPKGTSFAKYEEPQVAGTILGRIIKNNFQPSFPLLDHIAIFTKQKIVLDEKMSYLFTCGRDIFGKQVEHKPEGNVMLVLNKHNEVLGVALNDKTNGMYKNVYDRGIFLRQEMGKKR